jgi:hypothetical protein
MKSFEIIDYVLLKFDPNVSHGATHSEPFLFTPWLQRPYETHVT